MKKRNKIAIIGGGDLAKKVIRLLQKINKYQIIGYIDLVNRGSIFGIKYLGTDSKLKKLNSKVKNFNVVLAIGSSAKNLTVRKKLIEKIKINKIKTPSILSKNALVDKFAIIREGSIIFDGSFIDFSSEIGSFSLVNLNSTVCHNSKISKNVILSPNSVILGRCKIGENVFIGANSTLNPGIKITNDCVIGSGSLVNKNCIVKGTYVGNPAKKVLK